MSAPKKPGFRDKVKLVCKRDLSPAPDPTSNVQSNLATFDPLASNKPISPGTATPPPTIRSRIEPGQRIYDAAIRELEEEDQITIRDVVVLEDVDGIKAAQDAVLVQQRKCEKEKWTISVRGHTLALGTVAGSLSLLLDKIQPGSDIVSQVVQVVQPSVDLVASLDPLHIGLAITLIKVVLGVFVFFRDQMERLLSAMKTATYMLKQLSLYFEYFKQVNSVAAGKNLEEVLASSYSLVFAFLAVGYRALSKRGPKRAWELLWSKDKVGGFEESCSAASIKLEMAANHCNRDGSQKDLTRMKERVDSILDSIKKMDVIEATLQALDVKVDLQRFKPASRATYNFVDSNKEGTIYDYCLPGTRQKLIKEITTWCHQPSQTVFWICGMAGTGKSTLVRTVARQVEKEGLLAASFFFRQDIADQRHGFLFASSIAVQLLTKYPILRPYVAAALNADLTLPGGSISNQFAKLIKEPMLQVGLHKLVLIIDALDECRAKDANIILVELAQLAKQLELRIIITSRPESGLRATFSNVKPDSIRLEEIKDEIESDIKLFFRTCFANLVEEEAKKIVE